MLHPGDAVVSALGTPFYLAFKSVTCVVSAAIAAPVAGIAALSDSHFAPEIRRGLGDGINENCGPPYGAQPLSRAPGRANCRGARDDRAGKGAGSIVRRSRCSSAATIVTSSTRDGRGIDAGTAAAVTSGSPSAADDRRGSGAGCRWADQAVQQVEIDTTSITTYGPRHARIACADSPPRSQAGCFAAEGHAPIGASKRLVAEQ